MSEIIKNVIPAGLAAEIEWRLGSQLVQSDVGVMVAANDVFKRLIDDAVECFARMHEVNTNNIGRRLQLVNRWKGGAEEQDRDLHLDGVHRASAALSSCRYKNAGTVTLGGKDTYRYYGATSERLLSSRWLIGIPRKNAALKHRYAHLGPVAQAPHRGSLLFFGNEHHFAPALPQNTGRCIKLHT
jgi:hypothetical protein